MAVALSSCNEAPIQSVAHIPENAGAADGVGTAARFFNPHGVAVDRSGNLYVADTNNSTIRKITPAGVVSTFAGLAGKRGYTDGKGAAARFDHPSGLTIDAAGNLYVADGLNDLIRKITPDGEVSTIAGKPGSRQDPALIATHGNRDGTRTEAQFDNPSGIAVDAKGNLYVPGYNTVRKITPDGTVRTIAGKSSINAQEEVDMSSDGPATSVRLGSLGGIAIDQSGNLYVTGVNTNTVRKITPDGMVITVAGLAMHIGSDDGKGSLARFYGPEGITVDSVGNLYVADRANHIIRKITPDGMVSTLAGSASAYGNIDGKGAAARFIVPTAIAIDTAGNLVVTDFTSQTIRKVTPAGVVTTIAGPKDIEVDAQGKVHVIDPANHAPSKSISVGMASIR